METLILAWLVFSVAQLSWQETGLCSGSGTPPGTCQGPTSSSSAAKLRIPWRDSFTPSLLPHLYPQPFHNGVATGLSILRTVSTEHRLLVSWPVWYHCHCPTHMPAVVCALLWAPSLLNVLGGSAGASCVGVLTRFGVRCVIPSLPRGWLLYWWFSPGPAWPCCRGPL